MEVILYLIVFIFGLVVGSFLNCIIYRLALPNFSKKNLGGLKGRPRRKASFLRGRSFCPHCKHTLNWQDLIPLLSFLILKRKCRYCRQKISFQYPLVELATGFLFVLNVHYLEGLLFTVYCLLLSCFLIIIFVYDLKHFIIPDKVIYPAIIIALIFNFQFLIFNEFSIFNCSILSAVGAAAFFLAIIIISKGKWMGFGDVKLAFFMGLLLGFPNILVALFFAFLIGAIIGIGLILAKRKTLKSEVPFGPFLVAGTFIAMFWGQAIIFWYLRLFVF